MKNADLKKQLIRNAKLGKNKTTLPILDCIYFQLGTMTVTDLETTIVHQTDITGTGLMLQAELKAICAKLKPDQDIDLEFEESKVSVIVDGKSMFTFRGDNVDDFPLMPDLPTEQKQRPLIEAHLLKRALKYTSNDQLREAIRGVYVEDNFIVATDAHRMIYLKHGHGETITKPAIIPKLSIKCMDAALYSVGQTSTHVTFYGEDHKIIARAIDAKFPNWTTVIPDSYEVKATVDKRELKNLIDLGLLAVNKVTNQMTMTINGNCELSAEDIDLNSSFNSSTPAKCEGNIVIGFNGKLMQQCLEDIKTEKVSFKMSTPSRAIIMNNEILLMPVMLNR